ncbi:MAG: NHLP bacteriocin export ABC transporter permease/ATPase subunit, partial [Phormidesmis sp. CAN_BIN36]|nr:NHLP bacteriocin export ABC transporter permease/ATPase subunit [Phormidesmis sp. CAN_BIN36]
MLLYEIAFLSYARCVQKLKTFRIGVFSTLQGYKNPYSQQLDQQETQAGLHPLQAREQLDQQLMAETLDELAAVIQPKSPAWGTQTGSSQELLLAAAGAVGRALGVTIHPPSSSDDFSRLQNPIEAIARASRIRLRQITLREQWWETAAGPVLAYTLDGHNPVALLPVSGGKYEIFDPLNQIRCLLDQNSATAIAPTAYIFYRPFPEQLRPLTLLRFSLGRHWRELILILLTGIATTLLGMLIPQATAILIDQVIPSANRSSLVQIAFGLLAVTVGSLVFQLAQGLAIIRLETFADSTTQAAIWDRLLNLKSTFFRQFPIGDLNSRVSGVSQIREKLSGTVLKTLFSGLFSLLNLGLLFYYSGSLAIVAVGVALIYIAVTIVSGVLTVRKFRPLLEQQGQLFGIMVQLIDGVAKLRVAGAEARAFAYWGKQYSRQLHLILSTQAIEDILAVINKVLPALTNAILFGLAATMLQQSQAQGSSFSTGTFLAFNTAFGALIGGVTSLSSTVIDVLEVVPLWQRAQPILQATPEVDATKANPGRLLGKLTVDQLTFRFRADSPLTLDRVSLRVEPGEFIALVGPSGSGKSTFLRLLLGFEAPESGSICYDDHKLAGLDIHAVRRQLGVVLQTGRLMSASIFENIAGNALMTLDTAWNAAQQAGFADNIAAMPMGMHTVVSEGGTNLSGGQRQRLLIARALALKPQILLFDEATSALDNQTQAIVSESLDRLQVTRIVIA